MRAIAGVFLLALVLVGCSANRNQPLITAVPLPTATAVRLRMPTLTSNEAVSYEEIQQAVDHITGRDMDPTAPEVGLDGIVDQRIVASLTAYNQMMSGKKAVNWQGWYKGSNHQEKLNSYTISIWMKDPPVPDGCCSHVTLWGITPEQKEHLPLLEIGQHIQFSGTIDQADSAGGVEIHDARITLLP